ncbi:Gfo/Idh/MocA family protein [Pseudonocardia pini]|uniref:Gfo/Idh/MocA family protein n=1 Tax=Pseudonocardia pini TaxID=2758030 RepID=UPI0015F0F6E0|nr:Gfo/Idh/MocA family oxidoreductase [Pseudonocardia pini]
MATRHATVLAGFDDVELVAATDRDPARAREFARTFGATAFSDVTGLLASGVDAVYVCVPPSGHGQLEYEPAAAGVALFVEKPLGPDEATAESDRHRG